MKRLWFFVLLGSLAPVIGMSQNACTQSAAILEKLNTLHIQPRKVNDTLSADIFAQFFRNLDPHEQYFISKDTGTVVSFRNKLDDNNEFICALITKAIPLYRKKIEWYKAYADSLLAKPIDFTRKENGPTAKIDEPAMPQTTRELKERARHELKFKVLLAIYRQSASDTTIRSNAASFAKAEPIARQRVRKNELVKIEKLLKDEKLLSAFVNSSFLKAIPVVFDPHSEFFSKEEIDEFNENLNSSALSFGINLYESPTGDVKVANVVPGGPAWHSNQINKDDIILGMQWTESKEYIDFVDLDIEMIEEQLEKRTGSSAKFSVRKSTGDLRQVYLVKDQLQNEDNIVSGFVLTGKDSKRNFGYISLPGFFTDTDPNRSGCAVAVTKEIIKLKGESIEGLILDLRFNGGGSLYEAIELAGLFIDVGPIGVVETRKEPAVILKDMNRGVIYDGPLVIMVNGASASASELVAAALQDYNRAIVAGSTTYGKATGQEVFPVTESNPANGFIKITELRLFRVNGSSHQKQGVSPDYAINDLSAVMFAREEQSDFALAPRATSKKIYYTKLPSSYADAIKYTSAHAKQNETFASVEAIRPLFEATLPLERLEFMNLMKKIEIASKQMASGVDNGPYTVSNSKFDATVLKLDAYHAEMNKEILSQVASSIYVQEVYRLLDNVVAKRK